ncbi:MAG TPA: ATP-binding protein [Planctomycetaceae bacterium]|nr:ATP-binding protein [Planctomycetaceae bacterium]
MEYNPVAARQPQSLWRGCGPLDKIPPLQDQAPWIRDVEKQLASDFGNLGHRYGREVAVFLFRSIRRRLVSLFTGAMLLVICMAMIGGFGLRWHQEAVNDLDFLLHRSPNREQLSRAISRANESLYSSLDPRQLAAVQQQRIIYLRHLDEAKTALLDFRRRVESLPTPPELNLLQRDQVLDRIDLTFGELNHLTHLAEGLQPVLTEEDKVRQLELRHAASTAVTRIQRSLDNLPAYHGATDWGELSLKKQQQRSERLLGWLVYGTSIVVVFSIIILTCNFQWISIPVRSIARGCTRIANGDTRYRLPLASRWQDEFSDLVSGVNCMADRFMQAEEELQHKVRERSEQLIRSQKLASVGFLAAGVAHEINTPLNAISIAAESAEMRLHDLEDMNSEDGRDVMDRIAMIRRESRRCGDITRRLLDFSYGDKAGRIPTDMADLIREVLVMVQHLGRYSDRSVDFPCERSVIAEVNAAQMKQVILNLIANALQATQAGGHVNVRLHEQVDSIVISIEDDGCGMDEETLQHIFDPFFTTKETGQGTGLGLSITHRIIENHSGTITPISNGPGLGSTFQIRLPRRQPQANAA